MQVVFRTDSSVQIGTGHVMRCLTLADALRLKGVDCMFICRSHTGHLINLINQRGHHAVMLGEHESQTVEVTRDALAHAAWLGTDWTTDANDTQRAIGSGKVDWLVVDHYALDHRWEKAMRPFCNQLMVIDDLADRIHDCDLLLDQNLGQSAEDYRQLVLTHTNTLIGPRYALLRPEFAVLREESLERRKQSKLQHLLITLGGVDKDNLTSKVLQTLRICNLPTDLRITVVMGSHAPWLQNVQAIAATMPRLTQVLVNTNNMARLMTESDLAIGAAGGTAWERCALGLPTVLFASAENQRNGANALKKLGAVILIEKHDQMQDVFTNQLTHQKLKKMSKSASKISDGIGTTRVLSHLLYQDLSARFASQSDCVLLFNWANETLTRKNAFNSELIRFSDHQFWLNQRLDKPMLCSILIIEKNKEPIGQVRLEKNQLDEWEIDYSIAPNCRGKFLGLSVLRLGLITFSKQNKTGIWVGKVKRNNFASCRIFEMIGFKVRSSTSNVVCYSKSIESGIA